MRSHEGFAKFQMSLYFIVDNLVNKMIEDKIVVHEDLKKVQVDLSEYKELSI